VDGKLSPWVSTHANATKILALLALRLRLGPQSRVMKATKRDAGPVSYYDKMRLEKRFGEPWPAIDPRRRARSRGKAGGGFVTAATRRPRRVFHFYFLAGLRSYHKPSPDVCRAIGQRYQA
jgi:hypothetical protein